jgi:hypothetical protein
VPFFFIRPPLPRCSPGDALGELLADIIAAACRLGTLLVEQIGNGRL